MKLKASRKKASKKYNKGARMINDFSKKPSSVLKVIPKLFNKILNKMMFKEVCFKRKLVANQLY